MENEEDEDEAVAPSGSGNKRVLYRLLPFVFLLLFLVAGGYFALNSMRQSAHELGGGSQYKQLSANHAIYEGSASLPKEKNYFSSEDALSSASGGDPSVDRMKLGDKPGPEGDGSAPVFSAAAGGSGESSAGAQETGTAPRSAPPRTAMASRMQIKSSSFRSPGGSASKSEARAQSAAFQGGGPKAGTAAVQRETQGAAPKKGGGGVLDSLKGAFRASIYGARIASQDTAKSWIAQTFDATPEPRESIQYEDNVKASLDVVNPNSIPKFLRDQDVSVSAADTLTASKVTNPALYKDEDKKEEDSGAADAAKSVFSGAFNSMFSGFDLTGSESPTAPATGGETPPEDPGGEDRSAPSSDQDLVSVDEFGYISYGDPNGFQYVFDPDGNLMGCTDNAAGFSIPAGNSGCP